MIEVLASLLGLTVTAAMVFTAILLGIIVVPVFILFLILVPGGSYA